MKLLRNSYSKTEPTRRELRKAKWSLILLVILIIAVLYATMPTPS